MNDTFDASTIIFALLAIFIVWKLRSVLGTKVTIERKRDNVTTLRPANADTAARDAPASAPSTARAVPSQAPSPLPPADIEPPTLDASRGLDEIRRADRSFDVAGFVGGAQVAYRMIIEAFSRGDRDQLNALLGDEALRTFTAALDERGADTPATLTQVADIEKVGVVSASLKDQIASVTLRFKAHVVETPVAGGQVSPGHTIEANDLWTFARDIRNSDPNWKLVATSTENSAH